MKLVVQPEAVRDVGEAYLWYHEQHPATAARFRAAFDEAARLAAAQPDAYEILHRNTRRILLRRFPFAVYFRVVEDAIVVVACLHLRRAPGTWKRRK